MLLCTPRHTGESTWYSNVTCLTRYIHTVDHVGNEFCSTINQFLDSDVNYIRNTETCEIGYNVPGVQFDKRNEFSTDWKNFSVFYLSNYRQIVDTG